MGRPLLDPAHAPARLPYRPPTPHEQAVAVMPRGEPGRIHPGILDSLPLGAALDAAFPA